MNSKSVKNNVHIEVTFAPEIYCIAFAQMKKTKMNKLTNLCNEYPSFSKDVILLIQIQLFSMHKKIYIGYCSPKLKKANAIIKYNNSNRI